MKKFIFIALTAIFFTACGDNKSKDGDKTSTTTKDEVKPAATGDDAAMTAWLGGKMLSSTKNDPKYDMWDKFKFNADGTCTDKDNASAKWEIKDGQFLFHASMEMKTKVEKKDDSTIIFKRSMGDDTYKVTPIK